MYFLIFYSAAIIAYEEFYVTHSLKKCERELELLMQLQHLA